MKRIVDVRDEGGCRIDKILIYEQFIHPKFKARLQKCCRKATIFTDYFFVDFMPHNPRWGFGGCVIISCDCIYSSTLYNHFSFHDLLLQDRHNLYIWMFSLLLNCEAMSCVVSSQGQMLQKSHSLHRWYFWRLSASWNISKWGCVIISCDSLFTLQHSTMYSLFMIFSCNIGTIFTSECFLFS